MSADQWIQVVGIVFSGLLIVMGFFFIFGTYDKVKENGKTLLAIHDETAVNHKLLLLIARRSFGVYSTPEVRELLELNRFEKELIDEITAIKN